MLYNHSCVQRVAAHLLRTTVLDKGDLGMLNCNKIGGKNLLEPVCRSSAYYSLLEDSALHGAVVHSRHKQKAVGPHTTALED
jgi:hypothetical protein